MTTTKSMKGIYFFIIALFVCGSFLISPYKEELDVNDQIINDNGVLVLKLVYLLVLIIGALYFFRYKIKKDVLSVMMLLILFFSFYRFSALFFL